MNFILSILYVLNYGSAIPETHPCSIDIRDLNLEQKIEISIGCSKVDGDYAYSRGKLNAIAKFPERKL